MDNDPTRRIFRPALRFPWRPRPNPRFAPPRWLAVPVCVAAVILADLCPKAYAAFEPGEITFAEMNCVACHSTSPAVEQRLASRKSPRLGLEGARLSPTWVRDFLLNPQQEQPGNAMPDMLHGLPPAGKAAAAEALTHYIISLQSESASAATRLEPPVVKEGNELFHRVGCVACHAPQELPANLASETSSQTTLAALVAQSVPLGNLAKKYTVAALADFLRDPLKSRPAGRMPAQRLSEKEAQAVAMYLLRNQPAVIPAFKIPGLNFEHFEGIGETLPDFGKLPVAATGYSTNLSLENVPHKNNTGLRFRALLTVPREGEYTFWTESRDGSQLFIDTQKVVDNDGVHKPTVQEGQIRLTAGDHNLVVTYFHHVGPPVLKVSWAGPGLDKEEIPGTALSLADKGKFLQLADERPFVLDRVKAAKGRQVFETYNCAACHDANPPERKAPPLAKLAGSQNGCLALNPAASAPRFAFTAQQRNELVAFLAKLPALQQPLAPADQVRHTMTALNCYACHSRDGQVAPAVLRRPYFKVNGSADLGEEGSLPPHLNGVGAKLKPAWLEKVLFNGASVRPYMATRMPQFGVTNVQPLIAAFQQADGGESRGHAIATDPVFGNGLRLVGSEGLNCISCHVFAGHPSLGVPALDLTTAPERLTPDWFRRYLLNPAKLRPGTRMPQFWPDGVAANKSLLGGDTEKQVSAIWSYLASGQVAKNLPPGLIAPKLELVPKLEPLIYRNFIEGAGSRAIGVGYPEKVNLAFDANQLCLALLWHGQFMDASRHSTGRGEGFQPPLGYSVVKFPSGAPFAVLDDPKMPWPKTSARAVGYQFRGYVYDPHRRPEFHYDFGETKISDLFLPAKFSAEAEAGFRRKLSLQAVKPTANLWFRAALANKVEDLGNATFLVDGSVRLAFPSVATQLKGAGGPQILVRPGEGKTELLVPVVFAAGAAEIVEEISW